ncbi:dihydropteroate synthase [Marinobacter salarius]|jgi:dihydropteroate synthase|uniref:Dihydropteroate synthase n=1 Tax=Marinobacter salarius TaxID=1420917 RepID=A0A1W6K6D2_9GAMM|nr:MULTISPECIES: dihydropteroate synthase [Marinobacter]ARM82951.1 dihydropteroate synthase [Marinobacter salarius]KXJ45930.1 MAG: dihydropteroate synthase [Marinobacter sp. Hex_13]MBJ7278504.1 dihydropteroate synthase [Marinobacter salarius]MDC8457149.1 dihydropteroate synthase [Marinobacter sp. DS40M6]SFL80073.1 dihydropteroate synthase [Marinobacter salarius]|tara:strand:- start:741 stop:1574 length:834 start_codon:yes stop_codon:yes gene_type:complete
MQINFAGRVLDMSGCHVMGILNVTPDSFSDGGRYNTVEIALARAREMVADGAAFIDVGGESTRPGATPVSVEEELERVCPVVEAIARDLDVVVSVDTSSPQVMAEVVKLGAGMINDVRALQRDGAPEVVASAGVPVCVMHIQGEPDTMQDDPRYRSVRREVSSFLTERMRVIEKAGVRPDNIILDPGFGFGKSPQHNLQLLASLEQLQLLGHPILVGMSRKSMLGHITGRDVSERLPASLAAATISAMKGASIIRVHDVRETVDAVKVVTAMEEAGR